MTQSDQCSMCARYRGLGECAAFPNGIPQGIMSGEIDHEQPVDGDHGLQRVEATGVPEIDGPLAFPPE